jgi:hypothetical protein
MMKSSLLSFAAQLPSKACARLGYHKAPGDAAGALPYERKKTLHPLKLLSKLFAQWRATHHVEGYSDDDALVSGGEGDLTSSGSPLEEPDEGVSTEAEILAEEAPGYTTTQVLRALEVGAGGDVRFPYEDFAVLSKTRRVHGVRVADNSLTLCGFSVLEHYIRIEAGDISFYTACERCLRLAPDLFVQGTNFS